MSKKDNTTAKYRIDADNKLVVKKQVKLDGTWSLTEDHDLMLDLKAIKDSSFGDKIVLGGKIKDVTKNSLDFEVTRHDDQELQNTYILSLTGTWQADELNRLIFKVTKENSKHDILTFKNTWIIDKKHRIVYEFEKASLIYKKKETHGFIFKGYWNVTGDNRLYYELEQDNNAGFEFNIGTAIFEKNRIKYKITIGKGSNEKDVTIGGQWKITKEFGLTFEVDYGENEIKPISFGGQWDLSDDTTLAIKFNNGLEAKIDHKWLDGDGEAFIKYHQGLKDNRVDWGMGIKF